MADEYVVSVVLEGDSTSLANATNKGARAQKNLKTNTDSANIAFLAQVARYQAMTAALNQTIGGFNKLAGGLEAIGFERTANATRKLTKGLELIAGPAEIYLAYLTLTIALGKKDIAVKGGQTVATKGFTAAIWANTAALLANPLFLAVVTIISLVAVLVLVEKKLHIFGNTMKALLSPLQSVKEILEFIQDAMNGIVSGVDGFVDGVETLLNPTSFIRSQAGG